MWDSYDSLSVTHYRLTLCGISLTSVEEPSDRKTSLWGKISPANTLCMPTSTPVFYVPSEWVVQFLGHFSTAQLWIVSSPFWEILFGLVLTIELRNHKLYVGIRRPVLVYLRFNFEFSPLSRYATSFWSTCVGSFWKGDIHERWICSVFSVIKF